MKPEVLECQQCGDVIRELSDAEAQKVADNPYNYIIYCKLCQRTLRGENNALF